LEGGGRSFGGDSLGRADQDGRLGRFQRAGRLVDVLHDLPGWVGELHPIA
jgi:hypothetical protein